MRAILRSKLFTLSSVEQFDDVDVCWRGYMGVNASPERNAGDPPAVARAFLRLRSGQDCLACARAYACITPTDLMYHSNESTSIARAPDGKSMSSPTTEQSATVNELFTGHSLSREEACQLHLLFQRRSPRSPGSCPRSQATFQTRRHYLFTQSLHPLDQPLPGLLRLLHFPS